MSEDTKPVTEKPITEFARSEKSGIETAARQPVEQIGEPAPAKPEARKLSVRALRTFHEDAEMRGPLVHPGDEFECNRDRAVQLRAVGLIEFVNDSDQEEVIKGVLKEQEAATRRRFESQKLDEKHKTKPLRNPEIKFADAPAETKPGGK